MFKLPTRAFLPWETMVPPVKVKSNKITLSSILSFQGMEVNVFFG
jgi:hypothetical protein